MSTSNRFADLKQSAKKALDGKGCFVALFILGLANLYYYMANAGVLTHDELHSIMSIREGVYFREGITGYLESPRGLFILDLFAQYPQYCMASETAYRLFDIVAIGIAIYCAYRFMKKLFSDEIGRAFVAIFFACAAFSNTDHNAFLAFGWTYKIHIAYLFVLLECLMWHLETKKRSYLIASVVLYVFVSGLYEAFVTACVPIAALVIYYLWKSGELTAKRVFRYALCFAVPEIIYLGVYFALALTAPSRYSGASVSEALSLSTVLKVTGVYTTGAMPFVRTAYGLRAFASSLLAISAGSCFSWLKAIAVSFYAVYMLRRQNCTPGKLVGFGAILLVSAFLMCIPYGLSAQYVDWALHTDTKGCDASYYALFLLVAATTCFLGALFTSAQQFGGQGRLLNAVLSIVVFVAIAFVGYHSEYNNKHYAAFLDWQDNKYELFDQVVKSKAFAEIEDDATIYAPEFIGVYLDMTRLDDYAHAFTKKHYNFVNELPSNEKSDYVLRYYPDASTMMLGKMHDDHVLRDATYFTLDSRIAISETDSQAVVTVSPSWGDTVTQQDADVISG